LYQHVAPVEEVTALAERYRAGAVGYREAKELLIEAHEQRFAPARDRYGELRQDRGQLRVILARGAERARPAALDQLSRARAAAGIVPR
jgi:tryptophanyl-tRNA synthetase